MNFSIKKVAPYLIAIITFIVISIAYFSPILERQKIQQNDPFVVFTQEAQPILMQGISDMQGIYPDLLKGIFDKGVDYRNCLDQDVAPNKL